MKNGNPIVSSPHMAPIDATTDAQAPATPDAQAPIPALDLIQQFLDRERRITRRWRITAIVCFVGCVGAMVSMTLFPGRPGTLVAAYAFLLGFMLAFGKWAGGTRIHD